MIASTPGHLHSYNIRVYVLQNVLQASKHNDVILPIIVAYWQGHTKIYINKKATERRLFSLDVTAILPVLV